MTLLSNYCDPCEGENQIAFSSRLISGSFHSTTSASDNHVESSLEKCGENGIFIEDIASPLLFEAMGSRSLYLGGTVAAMLCGIVRCYCDFH